MNQRRYAERVVQAAHDRFNRQNPNKPTLPTSRAKIRKLARDHWNALSERTDRRRLRHWPTKA